MVDGKKETISLLPLLKKGHSRLTLELNPRSSNINEVIRAVLNSLFFFYKKFWHAPKSIKSTKEHKSTKSTTKQKHKNANKGTKI